MKDKEKLIIITGPTGAAASITVPAIVVFGVSYGVYAGMEKVEEKVGIEQKAVECVSEIKEQTSELAKAAADKVSELHIKETIEEVDVKESFMTAKNSVTGFFQKNK